MYTWYAKVLMISGEYLYVSVRNVITADSTEVAKQFFAGEVNQVNAFSPDDSTERSQVFIALKNIQAFWISDKPFRTF